MELACQCPVVVCCRCSPQQKADIVKLLKKHTGKRTCAIGEMSTSNSYPARPVLRLQFAPVRPPVLLTVDFEEAWDILFLFCNHLSPHLIKWSSNAFKQITSFSPTGIVSFSSLTDDVIFLFDCRRWWEWRQHDSGSGCWSGDWGKSKINIFIIYTPECGEMFSCLWLQCDSYPSLRNHQHSPRPRNM